MPSYAHKKLADEIRRIDALPGDDAKLAEWIKAGAHLEFLKRNARSDEVVIHASGPYTFVTSVLVPNDVLFPLNKDDLLRWSGNPYSNAASYVCGGGREDVWIESSCSIDSSATLAKGKDLIYGRTFEGWSGDGRSYFELSQEYAHLAGIHWRPEHGAYCHFDLNGDLEHVVSMSTREDGGSVPLVSASWPKLEEYLAISKSALVRLFDLTLLRRETFTSWGDSEESVIDADDDLFYRQKIAGHAGYTRGVQILQPRQPPQQIHSAFKGGSTLKQREHAEFLAHDWRNRRVVKISTDPKATTNYFEAAGNDLPFELSPAFFRPEVLSKYKTDREKYTIQERSIHCRSAWFLEAYDVNDAGQVHAYICYLRRLPYAEQLHWLSYNEAPKGGISERAHTNDFKGEFVTFAHPREEIMSTLRRWHERGANWWKLRDEALLNRANTPLTSSRDEWGDAFLELSQLIVEGFETKALRKMLDAQGVTHKPEEKTLLLLERLITNATGAEEHVTLSALRLVQQIRSKVKGHAGSSEGKQLAEDAIKQHGSFSKHFEEACQRVSAELETIERICGRHEA